MSMNSIRYVCLSDLHLGEEDSVLSNLQPATSIVDVTHSSPAMDCLVQCLRELVRKASGKAKPTLILTGDVLELALCEVNVAAMVFRRFLEGIMPTKRSDQLFERIIVIPGNHDHHLWELAREPQYVDFLARNNFVEPFPKQWHTTDLFWDPAGKPVESQFLTRLIQSYPHLSKMAVYIAYPALGLLNEDASKCIIFDHGHFTEWIYWLMSDVRQMFFPWTKPPADVWDLEAENFAWIDFFWSALGRSGDVGVGLETIYEKLGDKEAFAEIKENLAESLASKMGWSITDYLERKAVENVVDYLLERFGSRERSVSKDHLTDEGRKGLFRYIQGPIRRYIADRLIARRLGVDNVPYELKTPQMLADEKVPETTFVYGHTHKPFCDYEDFQGFDQWVDVYNTGGWIVDSLKPEACYGASIALVDEELNTTTVRMFQQTDTDAVSPVAVEEAPRGFRTPNPFHTQISNLINPNAAPWSDFSEIVANALALRRRHLRQRVYTRLRP
jgi:hypothetical protein